MTRAFRFASARTTTQSRATEFTQTARFVDRGAAFDDADRAAERGADFATIDRGEVDLAADLAGGVAVGGLDATAFGRDFPFAGFGAALANAGSAGTDLAGADLAGADPAGIALTGASFAASGLGPLSSAAIRMPAGTEGGAGDEEAGEGREDDAGSAASLDARASVVSSIVLESCCATTPAGSGVALATTTVVGFTGAAASAA